MSAPEPETLLLRFGQAVRTARTKRGVSQEALARAMHVSRTYVTDIEAGRRNVTLRNLGRLAVALDTPLAELLRNVTVD